MSSNSPIFLTRTSKPTRHHVIERYLDGLVSYQRILIIKPQCCSLGATCTIGCWYVQLMCLAFFIHEATIYVLCHIWQRIELKAGPVVRKHFSLFGFHNWHETCNNVGRAGISTICAWPINYCQVYQVSVG